MVKGSGGNRNCIFQCSSLLLLMEDDESQHKTLRSEAMTHMYENLKEFYVFVKEENIALFSGTDIPLH
jgi:hypothetical protein